MQNFFIFFIFFISCSVSLRKNGGKKNHLLIFSSLLLFSLSAFSVGLVHRQISTSLSSLHVRTLVIPYRPLSLSQYYCTNASGLPDTR